MSLHIAWSWAEKSCALLVSSRQVKWISSFLPLRPPCSLTYRASASSCGVGSGGAGAPNAANPCPRDFDAITAMVTVVGVTPRGSGAPVDTAPTPTCSDESCGPGDPSAPVDPGAAA